MCCDNFLYGFKGTPPARQAVRLWPSSAAGSAKSPRGSAGWRGDRAKSQAGQRAPRRLRGGGMPSPDGRESCLPVLGAAVVSRGVSSGRLARGSRRVAGRAARRAAARVSGGGWLPGALFGEDFGNAVIGHPGLVAVPEPVHGQAGLDREPAGQRCAIWDGLERACLETGTPSSAAGISTSDCPGRWVLR